MVTPKKPKSHTIYKLADGTRVPGVTTFLNVLNKPALIKWANELGLQGINSSSYVDNLAAVGTLAHQMIMVHLKGEELDTSDYTKTQIELAENSLLSYFGWEKTHKVEPILIETPLVSEEYRFGGTPDLLAKIDGVDTLMDFKTGKAIYPEHFIQVAAYWLLILEQSYTVDKAMILRIGRDEDEGFEVKPVKALRANWELFTHCQAIYELQKQLKKEEK